MNGGWLLEVEVWSRCKNQELKGAIMRWLRYIEGAGTAREDGNLSAGGVDASGVYGEMRRERMRIGVQGRMQVEVLIQEMWKR